MIKAVPAQGRQSTRATKESVMSKPIPAQAFQAALPAIGHNAPDETAHAATATVRSFDLPTALLAGTVGFYFAFLAVMAAAFGERVLIIPMAIFYIYIIMAFGVPALWVRMKPDHAARPLSLDRFLREGIATHTGQLGGRDAAIQVLIMPTMIFGWGIAMAVIAALVA
jgi:hypothetical protein